MELEALPAVLRPDFDMHIAELAMAAGLALEARMLLHLGADRLLVADLRPARLDRQVVAQLQPLQRDLQMDVALAVQQQFVGIGIVVEAERGILLRQLRQGRRQLHLVIAVLGIDRQRIQRRQRLRPFESARRLAARGQHIAGLQSIHAAKPDHLAGRPPSRSCRSRCLSASAARRCAGRTGSGRRRSGPTARAPARPCRCAAGDRS